MGRTAFWENCPLMGVFVLGFMAVLCCMFQRATCEMSGLSEFVINIIK